MAYTAPTTGYAGGGVTYKPIPINLAAGAGVDIRSFGDDGVILAVEGIGNIWLQLGGGTNLKIDGPLKITT